MDVPSTVVECADLIWEIAWQLNSGHCAQDSNALAEWKRGVSKGVAHR